jgi:hypothetical protein
LSILCRALPIGRSSSGGSDSSGGGGSSGTAGAGSANGSSAQQQVVGAYRSHPAAELFVHPLYKELADQPLFRSLGSSAGLFIVFFIFQS